MKRRLIEPTFHAAGILVAILTALLILSLQGCPGTRVGVTVPLPPLVIGAPPGLVVIPGTYAYYAPDVSVDIFFYHGFWYRPYRGQWYVSRAYGGPWNRTTIKRVPPVLRKVHPDYRRVPPKHAPRPYPEVQKNWRNWERDRYWDRHEERDRKDRRGRGRGRND